MRNRYRTTPSLGGLALSLSRPVTQKRLDEAQAYCCRLLDDNPLHTEALAWGMSRRFLMERHIRNGIAQLEKLHNTEMAHSHHLLTLCGLYLETEQRDKAHALLLTCRNKFTEPPQQALWELWMAQTGETQEFQNDFRAVLIRLEKQASRDKDFTPLRQQAEQALLGDLPLKVFVEVCEFMAHHAQWEFIADHADSLTSRIATANAVDIAIQGCFHCRRNSKVLQLIQEHKQVFPEGGSAVAYTQNGERRASSKW